MAIVSGLIWLIVTLSACFLTMRFYLPYYRKSHKAAKAPESLESNNKEESKDTKESTNKVVGSKSFISSNTSKIVVIVLLSLYSFVCGFFAYCNVDSVINIIKLAVGMIIVCMVVITDLDLYIIPNIFVLVLLAARILISIAEFITIGLDAWKLLANNLLVAIVVVVFLFIMSRITKGGLGEGDIKLYGAIGFLCGLYAMFFTLFFALLASAIVSIILLISKKKKLRDSFPMGPLICLGYGLTIILSLA